MSRELVVRWIGDVSSLEHASAKADAATEKSSGKMSMLGGAAKIAAVAGVGLLVEGLHKSVDAAEKAQAAEVVAAKQVENAGQSWKANSHHVNDALDATSRLAGFTKTDLITSFGGLVRTTGDVNRALKDTALVADVARGKNISLEAATQLVTKAELGKTGALTRAGIEANRVTDAEDRLKLKVDQLRAAHVKLTPELKAHLDDLKNIAQAQDLSATKIALTTTLTQKFGESAKAYGETAAGAHARLSAAVEELQVKIGSKLLPILTQLTQWLAVNLPLAMDKLSTFWRQHGDQIMAVANAIRTVIKLNIDMITGIINTFSDLLHGRWSKLWADVRKIVMVEVDAVRKVIEVHIAAIEYVFGGLAGKVHQVVNQIVGWFAGLPDRALGWGTSLGSSFKSGLEAGFAGLAGLLAKLVKAPMNAVISLWDNLRIPGFHLHIGMPYPVPDIDFGWGGYDLPDIQYLAAGGIVTSPTLAMIGEAGPEAVVPLSQGSFGGGDTYHIEFSGSIYGGNKRQVARELVDAFHGALVEKKRATGNLGLA